MNVRPGIKDVLWMAAGAAMTLVAMLAVLHLRRPGPRGPTRHEDPARSTWWDACNWTWRRPRKRRRARSLPSPTRIRRPSPIKPAPPRRKVEQERAELGELLTAGGAQKRKGLAGAVHRGVRRIPAHRQRSAGLGRQEHQHQGVTAWPSARPQRRSRKWTPRCRASRPTMRISHATGGRCADRRMAASAH